MVRAGGVGDVLVLVTALVPGSKPILQQIVVKALPGPAKRIEIGSHPARLVPGQRVPLTAVVRSAEGDVRPDTVRWTSSAPGTARVARGGLLEARGPGKATLTAAAGGVRATTVVEVASAAPASLAIEPAEARAKQGDVVRFRVVAKDAGGKPIAGVTPAWSFGPGQGAIDADGGFVAYQPGSYSVTATLGGRSAQRAGDGDPPRGAPVRQGRGLGDPQGVRDHGSVGPSERQGRLPRHRDRRRPALHDRRQRSRQARRSWTRCRPTRGSSTTS